MHVKKKIVIHELTLWQGQPGNIEKSTIPDLFMV